MGRWEGLSFIISVGEVRKCGVWFIDKVVLASVLKVRFYRSSLPTPPLYVSHPHPRSEKSLVDGITGLNSLPTPLAMWFCSPWHKRQSKLSHWFETCFGQWRVGGSGHVPFLYLGHKRHHYSHLCEERFSQKISPWGPDECIGKLSMEPRAARPMSDAEPDLRSNTQMTCRPVSKGKRLLY